MKILIFLTCFLAGCANSSLNQNNIQNADLLQTHPDKPQAEKVSFDFNNAAKDKRVFIVGGKIGENNKLYDFCDTFQQLVCERPLNIYQGKKGYLVETKPYIQDQYDHGYHVVLENNERLILKISNVYANKDPLESSLHLIDAKKISAIDKEIDKPLLDGLSTKIINATTSGGLVMVKLSNSETMTIGELNEKIEFLRQHIHKKDRDIAFNKLNLIDLKYDAFEKRWWLKPKSYSIFQLYPYFGITSKAKSIRLVAFYEGYDWIFFNQISVISGDIRYSKYFKEYTVERDNANNKVWEWIDIKADQKERQLINSISANLGKIKFSGKYESTFDITSVQGDEFKNIIELYELSKI